MLKSGSVFAVLLLLPGGFLVAEESKDVTPRALTSGTVGFSESVQAAPVLSNPDISVEGDIALGAATRVFRNGVIFLRANANSLGLGDLALAEHGAGGLYLTALGGQALSQNTTGDWNTAVGSGALQINTEGGKNTAVGAESLLMNSKGSGAYAAYPGVVNTAVGFGALRSNTGGQFNTAVGGEALAGGAQSSLNVAVGYEALQVNEANQNTAIGSYALNNNITGRANIAIGADAGYRLQDTADTEPKDRDYNIFIGNSGQVDDNRTIRIGETEQTQTFISGIQEQSVPVGIAQRTVCVLDSDQLVLCNAPDSARFLKREIRSLGDRSSPILDLRPVSFHFKPEYSAWREGVQFGLVAEEVEAVMPDLVAHSEDGEALRVHYDRLIPLLLNEVQRLHRQVAEQEERLRELAER